MSLAVNPQLSKLVGDCCLPTKHQINWTSGYFTRCTFARSSVLLNTAAASKLTQEGLKKVGGFAIDLDYHLLFSDTLVE